MEEQPNEIWLLRFFLHIEYAHVVINDNDSSALEFLYRWLLMTHDAAGIL